MSGSYGFARPASSVTSNSEMMRPASPARSLLSMTDSRLAASFRQEYGRHLNNYSEVYRLPADDEELTRLNKQHLMFQRVMGKYPPGLEEVLTPDNVETKTVVDLGCGSGSWIFDVARDFPESSCLAIDLVPMQSTSMPPNCRSEVDDINLGLQHYFGQFNVVHSRLVCTGVKDYPGLVDQIALVLRSRGLLSLTEHNFYVYGEDKKQIMGDDFNPNGPFLPQWMAVARNAMRRHGADVDAAHRLHEWVKDHPDFEDTIYRDFWLPVSPWKKGDDAETRVFNEVGEACREDLTAFLESGRPLLLSAGVKESFLNELETKARREMEEARTPLYVLVENVVARRKRW
ncbi:S-adenosyl-L-methionine-dependent methyltransferase [Abortiporus biennis]|nr:S-adenosyl-L-methionine-dependent methyltransferase [Abortiporus biennis]